MTRPRLSPALVGLVVGPLVASIDARWLMAYAAGLGETAARYYDTTRPGGPAAHPLFPVCYEWPAALALRAKLLDEATAARGVHHTHRLVLHRAPRVGDRLATTARVTAIESHRAGARVTLRFITLDAHGAPVTTTDHGSLYRDVDVDDASPGSPRPGRADAVPPRAGAGAGGGATGVEAITVAPHAAHVYAECARIWNPIHTDVAVARAAGLPGPILHGTATLALALGRIVAGALGGEPGRVREVAARFTGMVPMPAQLALHPRPVAGGRLAFEVTLADGRPVLDHGIVVT
jgi:acyl dehydratase